LLNNIPLECSGNIDIYPALNIFQNKTSLTPFNKGESVRLAARKEDSPFSKGIVAHEVVGISGEQN
jgi:hypothetical protein